jgi:thiamine-monophosphate kinase
MFERIYTTVPMSREQTLIERIRRRLLGPTIVDAPGVTLGIGDDAAVVVKNSRAEWIVTTDAFLENIHFLRKIHAADSVGYKSLARATSDLAAMGARPCFFLLTLAIPEACTGKWLDDFLNGMARAARRFNLVLIGGDTTKCPFVSIGLTVIGEVRRGSAVLRSGACPGDLLCVSGRLGEAELGWQILKKRIRGKKLWLRALKKHLYPEPRLAMGQWLADGKLASAMIDTSDGLSTDLGHICKASGVGARVVAGKIPVVSMPRELQGLGLDRLQLGIDGGEDYELLFTIPKKLVSRLPISINKVPITVIGEITREKKICLVDSSGNSRPLKPCGWDPFKKKGN